MPQWRGERAFFSHVVPSGMHPLPPFQGCAPPQKSKSSPPAKAGAQGGAVAGSGSPARPQSPKPPAKLQNRSARQKRARKATGDGEAP